jgi:hypothetical protein
MVTEPSESHNESGRRIATMQVVRSSRKAPWESVSYSGAGEDGAGCSDMEITMMELGAPVKNKKSQQ